MRRLNLCGNNIGDRGATLLAEMLKVLRPRTPRDPSASRAVAASP